MLTYSRFGYHADTHFNADSIVDYHDDQVLPRYEYCLAH